MNICNGSDLLSYRGLSLYLTGFYLTFTTKKIDKDYWAEKLQR